jgi:translation initiation factor IF-3
MAHQEFGVRLLERVKADLAPYGTVEQFPKLEGRQMIMVLGPRKTQVKKKPGEKAAGEKSAGEKVGKPPGGKPPGKAPTAASQ